MIIASYLLIISSFLIFDRSGYVSLFASLIGVIALILCAKGNPIGQVLIIVFSCLYGYISFGFGYYGEMITYLGMSAPMAVLSLISWIRNPYNGNHAEVKVNRVSLKEILFMLILTAAVTVIFYFILMYLGTANLLISTVSVTTSFAAVYLTFRRSAYYALAYALNDFVLIVMWSIAMRSEVSYLSVVICFLVFLLHDLYGFILWHKREKKQRCGAEVAV